MPFYLRKSVSAGPFRFNFSNSGVGVSIGVRGLRIGTGPRGHYIHAGRGGFYYRASLGRAGERRARAFSGLQSVDPRPMPMPTDGAGVDMVAIESGNVFGMRDEAFSDVLNEINEKSRQSRLEVVLPATLAIIGVGSALLIGSQGFWIALLAAPAILVGRWLDSYRRTTVLFYNVDEEHQRTFGNLTGAFDRLAECSAKWHVHASGELRDMATRKRNAGASRLVRRTPTELAYKLPAIIQSNTTPPSLQVGRQILYFFPDVVLIEQGNHFGAVSYTELQARGQIARFIEDGRVPADAQIVDYTWRYPNKNGGPDRRFNNNAQIPVCLYETVHLTSSSGLNEMVEFSRVGLVEGFSLALKSIPPRDSADRDLGFKPWSARPEHDVQPQLVPASDPAPPREARGWSGRTKLLVVFATLLGAAFVLGISQQQKQTLPQEATSRSAVSGANGSTPTSAPRAPAVSSSQSPSAPNSLTPSGTASGAPASVPPVASPVPRNDSPLTWSEVHELQTRLKSLGFDPGALDGTVGPATTGAVRRFEMARSLPVVGNIDRQTLERLRVASP